MNLEDVALSEISWSQQRRFCIIPLRRRPQGSQVPKDKGQNGGRQGLQRGGWGVRVSGDRVSIWEEEKISGDRWW